MSAPQGLSKARREQKGDWVVRLRATVVKEVAVKNCTREQAEKDPWEHAEGDEVEVCQEDYEVLSVEPNT